MLKRFDDKAGTVIQSAITARSQTRVHPLTEDL